MYEYQQSLQKLESHEVVFDAASCEICGKGLAAIRRKYLSCLTQPRSEEDGHLASRSESGCIAGVRGRVWRVTD